MEPAAGLQRAVGTAEQATRQLSDDVASFERLHTRRRFRRRLTGFLAFVVVLSALVGALIEAQPCALLDQRLGHPSGCLRTLPMSAAVVSTAYSSDSTILAAGAADGSIRVWKVDSGETVLGLLAQTQPLYAIAFAPNGLSVAAASQGAAEIWNVTDGRRTRIVTSQGLRSVAFSPDGSLLAIGGTDGTVRLWNIAQWREVRSLNGGDGTIVALAFTPDGGTLAAAGSDGKIALWHPALGDLLGRIDLSANSLVFAPDGKRIIAGGNDGSVSVWSTAPIADEQRFPPGGGSPSIESISLAPDGATVAAAVGDRVTRWRLDGTSLSSFGRANILGGQLPWLPGASEQAVSFSPNGRTLASGSANAVVRLWDLTQRPG
jgi:WD40 repeat protein